MLVLFVLRGGVHPGAREFGPPPPPPPAASLPPLPATTMNDVTQQYPGRSRAGLRVEPTLTAVMRTNIP